MHIVALVLYAVTSIALLGASPTPNPAVMEEGRHMFGSAWSPAIGAWLPSFGDGDEPWRHGAATTIHQRDGFVYEGTILIGGYWGSLGPADGTRFVYGEAGPPKGHVVYDPIHHIAFFEQGCCSFDEVVAATDVAPPPKQVVTRDLSDLHTARGIRFGATSAEVMRIYGTSRPLSVSNHPELKMLAYTTWVSFKSLEGHSHSACGQMENFIFRRDQVVFIQFENGC
jgi:hypothetical protein